MCLIKKLRAEILLAIEGKKKSCACISCLVLSDLFGYIYTWSLVAKHANPHFVLGAEVLAGRTPYWGTRGSGRSVISPRVMSPSDFSAGLSCIKSLAGSYCVSDIFILKASIGDLLRHLLEIL